MIEKVAYNLGRNDEEPNIQLAIELCASKDKEGIKEIVKGLESKDSHVANDCIKVIYEIGERQPELIEEYVSELIKLLKGRNNRLIWGAMTALSQIAPSKAKDIYDNIDIVLKAYEEGSVITRDNSITLFAELAIADKAYEEPMVNILIQHLKECRPKEVAQHLERLSICINEDNIKSFKEVIEKRIPYLSEAQKKRVNKVFKKIMQV